MFEDKKTNPLMILILQLYEMLTNLFCRRNWVCGKSLDCANYVWLNNGRGKEKFSQIAIAFCATIAITLPYFTPSNGYYKEHRCTFTIPDVKNL